LFFSLCVVQRALADRALLTPGKAEQYRRSRQLRDTLTEARDRIANRRRRPIADHPGLSVNFRNAVTEEIAIPASEWCVVRHSAPIPFVRTAALVTALLGAPHAFANDAPATPKSVPDPTASCPGGAAYAKQQASNLHAAIQSEAAPIRPDLKGELKAMVGRDQEARFALIADPTNASKQSSVVGVDAANLTRLKAIVAGFGFPTAAMVGHEGVRDAWLLTQHADDDPPFQRQILAVLKGRAPSEVRAEDLALLEDRVLVHEGKPQRYGSQFTLKDGVWQPQPIDDPAQVDERRAQANLMPLADYTCVLQHMYSSQK
jgi:hypothetical protein